MKFLKLTCALLAMLSVVPAFAVCRGGSCPRNHKRAAVARKAVRNTRKRMYNRARRTCTTCKTCKGGFCRIR
jgi:hypothetical protein